MNGKLKNIFSVESLFICLSLYKRCKSHVASLLRSNKMEEKNRNNLFFQAQWFTHIKTMTFFGNNLGLVRVGNIHLIDHHSVFDHYCTLSDEKKDPHPVGMENYVNFNNFRPNCLFHLKCRLQLFVLFVIYFMLNNNGKKPTDNEMLYALKIGWGPAWSALLWH